MARCAAPDDGEHGPRRGHFILLGTALGFTSYLIDAQVPMHILAAMQQHITSRAMFLLALNIFLLIG